MNSRDDVKSYLRTLSLDEMILLCDEVLQEGWEPRMVSMGCVIVLKSCSDRVRLLKVIRNLTGCSLIDAKTAVDNLPFELVRESNSASSSEVSRIRAICRENGITFEIRENLVEDDWQYPPTIRAMPMA